MMVGTKSFKLLNRYFSAQTQLFRSNPHPFTRNPLTFGIVIIGPEMILQIGASVINLGSGKHGFLTP